MPKSESVSRGGKSETKLVLFASERRHLKETLFVLDWIVMHAQAAEADLASEAQQKLADVLKNFPELEKPAPPEKTAKEPAVVGK